MIGLGTQDDGAYAAEFVESRSTYSFPMYWDETFESWTQIGISSQPSAVLLGPGGDVLAAWRGGFPEDEVLELAANA
ncbi:MAG: hypothetical protein QNJ12_20295 [Ilumatobacter sp.]|uniref:hypothetical protein n=1 Tax=Ilumatobacter sp. TaxID=1967498 RepID=UPI002633096A|nr:hypothetical protein [Ilumatobacter sp.]MDJ0771140.1 hypothetical protein [Ilumatobacter sp.]